MLASHVPQVHPNLRASKKRGQNVLMEVSRMASMGMQATANNLTTAEMLVAMLRFVLFTRALLFFSKLCSEQLKRMFSGFRSVCVNFMSWRTEIRQHTPPVLHLYDVVTSHKNYVSGNARVSLGTWVWLGDLLGVIIFFSRVQCVGLTEVVVLHLTALQSW